MVKKDRISGLAEAVSEGLTGSRERRRQALAERGQRKLVG